MITELSIESPAQAYNLLQVVISPEAQIRGELSSPGLPHPTPPCPARLDLGLSSTHVLVSAFNHLWRRTFDTSFITHF